MITNLGKKEILSRILNGNDKAVLHLYKTDKILGILDTVQSFDEVNSIGYTPIRLESQWSITSISPITASYVEVSFNFDISIIAYGYYITNSTNTIVLFAEKFTDGQYKTSNAGGTIKIIPSIQLP